MPRLKDKWGQFLKRFSLLAQLNLRERRRNLCNLGIPKHYSLNRNRYHHKWSHRTYQAHYSTVKTASNNSNNNNNNLLMFLPLIVPTGSTLI